MALTLDTLAKFPENPFWGMGSWQKDAKGGLLQSRWIAGWQWTSVVANCFPKRTYIFSSFFGACHCVLLPQWIILTVDESNCFVFSLLPLSGLTSKLLWVPSATGISRSVMSHTMTNVTSVALFKAFSNNNGCQLDPSAPQEWTKLKMLVHINFSFPCSTRKLLTRPENTLSDLAMKNHMCNTNKMKTPSWWWESFQMLQSINAPPLMPMKQFKESICLQTSVCAPRQASTAMKQSLVHWWCGLEVQAFVFWMWMPLASVWEKAKDSRMRWHCKKAQMQQSVQKRSEGQQGSCVEDRLKHSSTTRWCACGNLGSGSGATTLKWMFCFCFMSRNCLLHKDSRKFTSCTHPWFSWCHHWQLFWWKKHSKMKMLQLQQNFTTHAADADGISTIGKNGSSVVVDDDDKKDGEDMDNVTNWSRKCHQCEFAFFSSKFFKQSFLPVTSFLFSRPLSVSHFKCFSDLHFMWPLHSLLLDDCDSHAGSRLVAVQVSTFLAALQVVWPSVFSHLSISVFHLHTQCELLWFVELVFHMGECTHVCRIGWHDLVAVSLCAFNALWFKCMGHWCSITILDCCSSSLCDKKPWFVVVSSKTKTWIAQGLKFFTWWESKWLTFVWKRFS